MLGTSLSKQERECKLYDEFDKFTHVKGEMLYTYYLRFAQLINDLNTINMTMQTVQVNTKFLNSLLHEWGKFMTDVKLARDRHTSNFDQLYGYLKQHEIHANETRIMRERYPDPLALAEFPQMESGLSVPTFLQGNDLIACLNKVIITVQQVQGRQGQNVAGSGFQGNSSGSRGNSTGQAKTVKCYNYQGMGHMARQYEEELAFLADLGIADGSANQTFTHNAVFQTDDLDAYDSDCDDIPFVAAVLMTNLSSCEPETVSEYSEQSPNVVYPDVELTSDSNVIPYSQYLQEPQQASVPNTDTSTQQNSLILSMFKQISKQMYWLPSSDKNSEKPSTSNSRVKIQVPSELPKVSLVNKSLKKLRFHLAKIDPVVKSRITPNAVNEGLWEFEHTKKYFVTKIIPWLNLFKDYFQEFDKDLIDEITEVQDAFTQMEAIVEQYSVDRKYCEIQ
ncbi:hypothetical protein Tco_1062754 [Tanacetum coccineum]